MPIDIHLGIPNNEGMRTSDAIEWFGGKAALAKALDLATPSVYEWGEFPPPLRQIQIEKVTRGKLKAEADVFSVTSKKAAA